MGCVKIEIEMKRIERKLRGLNIYSEGKIAGGDRRWLASLWQPVGCLTRVLMHPLISCFRLVEMIVL